MGWVALIPLVPVAAFVVMLVLPREVRNRMLWLPLLAMSGSLGMSLLAFARVAGDSAQAAEGHVAASWTMSWPLAVLGGEKIDLSLALDPLGAATLSVVAIVAVCVQVYSLSYMRDDRRVGWYYAVLSLFTAAMFALVLSGNLLLTFAVWELMGLCSYLLIGFWYEMEGPRKASQKAFMTTRVGDIGFIIALCAIYGAAGTFDLATVIETVPEWSAAATLIASIGLLWAAMGKSAQMPLHVWLPDAMAGPTPASALIHAATMVAAGVFVVARTLPIFEQAPGMLDAMLVIGLVTAIGAGLVASVQYDIKKVLAYSTISQLGLMFVGLGAGSAVAGLFHLTTHAFFKSLLFLGSGAIIHATHTQDMREMGGLARKMPKTTIVFTVGALALAGVPPLAGFFSKDEILLVLEHGHRNVAFGAVLAASALTAFYMTRLWFRVFAGPSQSQHVHDADALMVLPMAALALITLAVGWAGPAFAAIAGHEGEYPGLTMWAVSYAVSGLGIGIGWWVYGRRSVVVNTSVWKKRFGLGYDVLVQKLYFDITYDRFFIAGFFRLTEALSAFDARVIDGVVNGVAASFSGLAHAAYRFDTSVVDGMVNGLARATREIGIRARSLQSGQLQSYQRLVVGAVVALMLILVVLKGA